MLLFLLHSKVILVGHYDVKMNSYITTPLTSKFALFVNFINDTELNKYQIISEVILRCTGLLTVTPLLIFCFYIVSDRTDKKVKTVRMLSLVSIATK